MVFEDTRITAQIEPVSAGLHVVRVPLPVRVEPVNCYVGEAEDGSLTIVDTGLAYGASDVWSAALATLDRTPADIGRIVITHYHPDHIGAAKELHDLSGAPVVVSALTARQSPEVWGPGLEQSFARIERHLVTHGMPAERVGRLHHEPDLARMAVGIPDEFTVVEPGDELQVGGARWTVVLTPGHADGHLCLYDEAGRRMIAGDHLLERISPAVGLFPGTSADPLGSYLASLEETSRLAIEVVLPGHGTPFGQARARIAELVDHHEERLQACLDATRSAPATAHEVAMQVFGPQPEAANERFAVTETLAHLERARLRGEPIARATGDDGTCRYRCT